MQLFPLKLAESGPPLRTTKKNFAPSFEMDFISFVVRPLFYLSRHDGTEWIFFLVCIIHHIKCFGYILLHRRIKTIHCLDFKRIESIETRKRFMRIST